MSHKLSTVSKCFHNSRLAIRFFQLIDYWLRLRRFISVWHKNATQCSCRDILPPLHLNMPLCPSLCLSMSSFSWLPLAVTATHTHTHTHIMWSVNRQWCPTADGGGRQMFTLDGDGVDLPGQGPGSSQQGVHQRHGEVLPLPGAEVILLHHLGHGQLLQQSMNHPEKQRAHQDRGAWVALQHRKQGLHPLLSTPALLWLTLAVCLNPP